MQLRLIIFISLLSSVAFAQKEHTPLYNPRPTADFLFNYYEQDGVHSAVTGGDGTERLIDRSSRIRIHIPLDSLASIEVNVGYNYYSSASTDKIDSEISSASSRDGRGRFKVKYQKTSKDLQWTFSMLGGSSIESDYLSASIGAYATKHYSEYTDLTVGLTSFFDRWIIYPPEEFRDPKFNLFKTDKRESHDIEFALTHVLNKRTKFALIVSPAYQEGLLSTPFHRVYFTNGTGDVERLPSVRKKLPLAARLNYFLLKHIVIRSLYRFYIDDWGIRSHTLEFEPAFKIGRRLVAYPFFRWHTQDESDHFAPIFIHEASSINILKNNYSSDYDLSSFESSAYGLGLRYQSSDGIFQFINEREDPKTFIDNIELRYSRYERSDGLDSESIGLNLGFTF